MHLPRYFQVWDPEIMPRSVQCSPSDLGQQTSTPPHDYKGWWKSINCSLSSRGLLSGCENQYTLNSIKCSRTMWDRIELSNLCGIVNILWNILEKGESCSSEHSRKDPRILSILWWRFTKIDCKILHAYAHLFAGRGLALLILSKWSLTS